MTDQFLDWAELAGEVDDIFSGFQQLTFTRTTTGAYDPSTGTSSISTSTQTANGAIFEWSPGSQKYGQSNIPSTFIADGDKQLYLSPVGINEPQVNDSVTDVNGVVYIIKMIKPLMPAGVPVLYECNINGI